MSLTATEPPREVIDGLILDAAWERAQQLEIELLAVRHTAEENYKELLRAAERRQKLASGIAGLLMEYQSSPRGFGKTMADVMAELAGLLEDG